MTTDVIPLDPLLPVAFTVALALFGAATLAIGLPRVRGTTLVAPWCWSLVSLGALIAAAVVIILPDAAAAAQPRLPILFAASMSTFCPMMSLLGAKRPQDRGWQFIVLSLWSILSLPAFEWLLFGGVAEIHPARFWFLVILTAVGVLNGVATRLWPAAVIYCLGQVALLLPFLEATQAWLHLERCLLAGLTAIVASWGVTVALARTHPRAVGLDRVWLDFRDSFGVVWGLRIAERMNASSAMYGWGVVLHWRGFVDAADGSPAAVELPAIEDSLRTLLRRFVSAEWIDERMGADSQRAVAETSA